MYTYTDRELSLPGCFAQHWCMQQKVHLLNVNIGQDMREEIYSDTCLTDCDTTNVPMC